MEETVERLDLVSQGKGLGGFPILLKHRFTGMGSGRWNPTGITSFIKYPIQTYLDKFLLKEGPSLVMNPTSLSHHLQRKSHWSCFTQRSGEKESLFLKRIPNYPPTYTGHPPAPQIPPLQCIFHSAARVFLRVLKPGFPVASECEPEIRICLPPLVSNWSKFYLSIKIQNNGHLFNKTSFNSSHHDSSFLFHPYHLAGFN